MGAKDDGSKGKNVFEDGTFRELVSFKMKFPSCKP